MKRSEKLVIYNKNSIFYLTVFTKFKRLVCEIITINKEENCSILRLFCKNGLVVSIEIMKESEYN